MSQSPIGSVGGVARGVSAALAGGQAGALVGTIAEPFGITPGYLNHGSSRRNNGLRWRCSLAWERSMRETLLGKFNIVPAK